MKNIINLKHSHVDLHGAPITDEAAREIELAEPTIEEFYDSKAESGGSYDVDVFISELRRKVTYRPARNADEVLEQMEADAFADDEEDEVATW